MGKSTSISIFKAYLVPIVIMIIIGLVLFVPAGSLGYWQSWIWWSIILMVTLFITTYFLQRNPELLSRRMNVKEKEPLPVMIKVYSG